ncbi:dTDP-4-dehydrorhamnose reductase [Mesorhizobium australicum]|uniref:dTDP-4-dehydrorhamnose reductase n=1 Tax=Mesorhizobium australicum TaxID=536018 RepID=A0A1X7NRK3_9HYPH|nr:dTDP-4-dehydrorhamnose reductase [Mesorhizobium australicum]
MLVFGRSGQVATELQRLNDVVALGRDQVDLLYPAACAAVVRAHRPRAVINAAAYTGVDAAEEDEAMATVINANAPAAMARACAALDVPFVHISTDYVFAGTGSQSWTPDDSVDPQNAYGRSKLAGEEAIRAVGGRYAIMCTSWVFCAHGGNFVKTMLSLSESGASLRVVDDQIGAPPPSARLPQPASTSPINWAKAPLNRAHITSAERPIPTRAIPPARSLPWPSAPPSSSRLPPLTIPRQPRGR